MAGPRLYRVTTAAAGRRTRASEGGSADGPQGVGGSRATRGSRPQGGHRGITGHQGQELWGSGAAEHCHFHNSHGNWKDAHSTMKLYFMTTPTKGTVTRLRKPGHREDGTLGPRE